MKSPCCVCVFVPAQQLFACVFVAAGTCYRTVSEKRQSLLASLFQVSGVKPRCIQKSLDAMFSVQSVLYQILSRRLVVPKTLVITSHYLRRTFMHPSHLILIDMIWKITT
jgi:hypothetical protein